MEFDLDGDFDEDETSVFCPQCKINLAKILPETPERLVIRTKRLEEAHQKEKQKLIRLILESLAVLAAVNFLILKGGNSYFLMLIAGLFAGIPAGLWTRRITADRTYRAGLLAGCLYSLILAVNGSAVYGLGWLPALWPALRNLFGGIVTAWIFAVFEKNN